MSWRGRLSRQIQELRIHFCQTSPESDAMRKFVASSYPTLRSLNPRLPILIRECQGVSPRFVVRYDFGKEIKMDVAGLPEKQIEDALEQLALQSDGMPRSEESQPFQGKNAASSAAEPKLSV